MMMEKLYDALRAANAPDEKARAAAVEAADFENRLAKLDGDMALMKAELKTAISELRTEIKADMAALKINLADLKTDMVRWMIGVAFAIIATIVGLLKLLGH